MQFKAEERAECERVGHTPGDSALRIDAFEVSDHQQSEVNAGSQTRPSGFRVERFAGGSGEVIKSA